MKLIRNCIISLVIAGLITLPAVSLAADLTPDQSEQVKLKSAKWGEQRQKVDALTKKGKYPEAEAILKSIIAERETLGLDLLGEYDALATVYTTWGKKDQAESTYKNMVEVRSKLNGGDDPQVIYPLQQYAACLEKNGKKDEAKALRARAVAIRKAADSMPKFPKISVPVGSAAAVAEGEKMRLTGEKLVKGDQQNKAVLYFDRAIALNPKDAVAYCDRGETNSFLDRSTQSMSDFNHAIKLNPTMAKAYRGRAWQHENVNQYKEALADFQKAFEVDPTDTESMGDRAKLLDTMGRHKEAVAGYTQVIKTNPALYWPYVQRAVASTAMKQYKDAIADYSTLVNRAPEDPDYHEYRGAVYLKDGQLKAALDDFNKLVELSPKYSVGYHERAKIYEKLDGKKSPRVVADYALAKKLGYSN